MKKTSPRWPIQLFRIATLVVPSAIAWEVAFSSPHPSHLTEAVMVALAPLWVLMAGALFIRSIDALVRRRRGSDPGEVGAAGLLDRLDVLTASGSAMVWLAAAAIVGSVWVGWASLSVVGLLGMGLTHLVVLWTWLRVGGRDPWRRASITRRFVPETVVEGAPVIEEVRFSSVRIPTGFRLFTSGRVGPRWATSRYLVEDTEAEGEILMESDVGPALRGEHDAEPMEVWFQDVFGLCRSPRVRAGAAHLTVLPRPRPVDGARHLLGKGGSDLEPRPEERLPTEGSLKLREYQPGDDARRIHWVRSLTARQVVVRLPDELPPDQPAVRLVLDTYLPGADALTCAATGELLDALVAVWLGVGRSLLERGARVTLVTTASLDGKVGPRRQRLTNHTQSQALKLGAQVRWQDALPLEGLLSNERSLVVSCRLQPDPAERGAVRWIVVPEAVWTCFDDRPQNATPGLLPHPLGTADNRWSRRRRERARQTAALRDHKLFSKLCADTAKARPGTFVARDAGPLRIKLEAMR